MRLRQGEGRVKLQLAGPAQKCRPVMSETAPPHSWNEVKDAIGASAERRTSVKYVILLMGTEAARAMTEAEGQAWYAEIGAWYEKGGGGSGKLVEGGHQLQPPATAKTIRASGVTDGPFMETKEALGGYSVLETDTIEEAIEIAKTWPGVDRGWMTIEVRPTVEM
jgi:hypothetical protein